MNGFVNETRRNYRDGGIRRDAYAGRIRVSCAFETEWVGGEGDWLAHNPEAAGSNPVLATSENDPSRTPPSRTSTSTSRSFTTASAGPRRATLPAEESLHHAASSRASRLGNLMPGRKSLSGARTHSPALNLRMPQAQFDAFDRLARRRGVTRSTLARQVLQDYLDELP